MLQAEVRAEHGFDVLQATAKFDTGIEGAVRVKDIFDFEEESVELRSIHGFQIRCLEPALAGFQTNGATESDYEFVVFVEETKSFLTITNLGQI